MAPGRTYKGAKSTLPGILKGSDDPPSTLHTERCVFAASLAIWAFRTVNLIAKTLQGSGFQVGFFTQKEYPGFDTGLLDMSVFL
jgi:hypothetical protein